VPKGWLGLSVTLSGIGPRIASVEAGGPAATAGLQVNDVIRSVNGQVVRTAADLRSAIEARKPGERVSLTYERSNSELRADVTLSTAPANARIEATPSASQPSAQIMPYPDAGLNTTPFVFPVLTNQMRSGLALQPVTPDLKQKYSLQKDNGLVIVNVVPQSYGARAGFQEGDLLLAIGGTTVSDETSIISSAALDRVFDALPPGTATNFRVQRGATETNVALTLPARSDQPALAGTPPALRLMIENLVDSGAISVDQAKVLLGSGSNQGPRVGQVKDVSASKLTLYFGAQSDEMSIAVNQNTRFQRGSLPINGSDLRSGEIVMVLSMDGGKTALAVLSYGA
jgi:hypothetical protein